MEITPIVFMFWKERRRIKVGTMLRAPEIRTVSFGGPFWKGEIYVCSFNDRFPVQLGVGQ